MRGVAMVASGVCLAAAVACGGGRAIDVERGAAPQISDSLYVRIINDHFNDARIHAVYEGGARYTLGLVVGKSSGQLTAIAWQPRALVFEISFIGPDEVYFSDEVILAAGDVIQLTIPPNIATSVFFRRP